MDARGLLRELDGMTHDTRMRRMVEVGRQAERNASARAALGELERGDVYQRLLALQSCYGSGDGAHAVRSLQDPSRGIRGLALVVLAVVGGDDEAQAALRAAGFAQRRTLLRQLAKRRRFLVIDTFLDWLSAEGGDRLSALLRFGSPEAVLRPGTSTFTPAGAPEWDRLARRHPALAAAALRERAEAAGQLDPRLLLDANAALPALAERAPDAALALVDALLRTAALAQLDLATLARRRPAAVADRLLAAGTSGAVPRTGRGRRVRRPYTGSLGPEPGPAGQVRFERVAHRLDTERLIELQRRCPAALGGRSGWFRRLPPAVRARLWEACGQGWRGAVTSAARGSTVEPDLVTLLPGPLREAEGRRNLALPALAAHPERRLPYAAFLPWEEAETLLRPTLGAPEPDLRALAFRSLLGAVRFQRHRAAEALRMVRARKHEADPVRAALLGALAGLPPATWQSEHLNDLSAILRDALDAADCSPATASAAQQLVAILLPRHPAWSAGWLGTLVRERGYVSIPALEDRLTDADARPNGPVLLPVLQSWATREREAQLVAALQSLGRRLPVVEGAVDLLEDLVRNTRGPWYADAALQLLRRHWPARFRELVPRLLRDDPSWATRPAVYGYLHRRRQDLLTPFLGRQAYRGRWSTGRTRLLQPFAAHGFRRWTPEQQATFAAALSEVMGDTVRDTPAVLGAIRQLAAMPALPPDRLVELASDRRPAVREGALRALGRLDAGGGVETLLAALGDERARVAIYALRRALLEMPAPRALELLRSVPLEKVTVAKEVVRLAGELPGDEAYRYLLLVEQGDLHRDVRIALLRALWSHLEADEPWQLFDRAVDSGDAAQARALVRVPADRLSERAQGRLAALLARLVAHPDPQVRLEALLRCRQLPVHDAGQLLLRPLLAALDSVLPDQSAAAAQAIFATYAGRQASLVGQAAHSLLPNRRALQTFVVALQGALAWAGAHLVPTARAVLEVLAGDRLVTAHRLDLAAAALPWDEVAALLEAAAASGDLHAGALSAAVRSLEHGRNRADAAEIESLEASFGSSPDERLRRLGLAALIALAASPRGWDAPLRLRLDVYRADPSPLVASAAQFTLPPEEEPPAD